MELTLNISAIVAIIGALTVLTNIIVEVLKRATWEKMPTNLLAIIVAMVLTLVAFFGLRRHVVLRCRRRCGGLRGGLRCHVRLRQAERSARSDQEK